MVSSIYSSLPIFIQNAACSMYGFKERRVRLGGDFRRYYEFLLESENASHENIIEYQNEAVKRLIVRCYENVKYYRRIMDELGLKPADITSVSELRKLPVLNKEDVFGNYEELISNDVIGSARTRTISTSGTTGKALRFLTTEEAVAFQWATWWRHRSRFGIKPLTWHVNFSGKLVTPLSQTVPPYWRWNYPMRQAYINMQHISESKILPIYKFIDRGLFQYFSGYPSVVSQLCQLVQDKGWQLYNPPKVVFLGAENIQEFQLPIISDTTGAVVTDQYGFSEGAGNASKCELDRYHIDWEFGVLDVHQSVVNADGSVTGDIVATGFANAAFPFVRYLVGDTATFEAESYRCPCGRQSRVIRTIHGRAEDYVLTPEGNRIMRFDYIFKKSENIREAQIVQEREGEILIRVVPRAEFSDQDKANIRDAVSKWISPELRVEFEHVREIERTNAGKFKPVVSLLKKRG